MRFIGFKEVNSMRRENTHYKGTADLQRPFQPSGGGQSQFVGLKKKWLMNKRTKKLQIIERNKYKFQREAGLEENWSLCVKDQGDKSTLFKLGGEKVKR